MSNPNGKPTPTASTWVELLRRRADRQPEQWAYSFLTDGETEGARWTYAELDQQARSISASLQEDTVLGERALLLYPPGLEFIAAFFGCLYSGVTAVPLYPPRPPRTPDMLPAVIKDAQPSVVLTTASIFARRAELSRPVPELQRLRWIATDAIAGERAKAWRDSAVRRDTLALLQYTSGSTAAPKGVMLSHDHLLHNERMIQQIFQTNERSVVAGWLPLYHDMGLIGNVLHPLFVGIPCILLSPIHFLQRPYRWLRTISRYRVTHSGGPNFAYDLCVRKVITEERLKLDLSHWRVAFNGAEPVRHETLERFSAAFAPCGFRRESFRPCYGLAEATLIVSGRRAAETSPIKTAAKPSAGDADARSWVGCGGASPDQKIRIVDPVALTSCPPGRVGEIWVAGPNVAQGYWNRPAETERLFQAKLADTGEGPFLRTGDLGFLQDGELFVTGRLKDLIIIRGQNHYPEDIERTVEQSHTALRPHGSAAFALEVDGIERLVIVQELEYRQQPDLDAVVQAICRAVTQEHEAPVYAVALVKPGSLPKTSSGKIQRYRCRAAFLQGSLTALAEWRATLPLESQSGDPPATPHTAEAIVAWLAGELAARLGADSDQIDTQQSMAQYGLDSLMAIELMHNMETRLGISLPITYFLQGPSLVQLANQAVAQRASRAPATAERAALSHAAVAEYPLSFGQKALWFLHQLAPASAAYHIVRAVRLRTDSDVAALRRALQALVDRHPALRTTFTTRRGQVVQRVHASLALDFQEEDASAWSEDFLNDRLMDAAHRAFDLEQGPPLRVALFTRSPSEHILLFAAHHIVADFWSLAVLLRELGKLYPAEKAHTPASLPPLSASYRDFVRWQADWLAGPEGERSSAYWQKQLAGEWLPWNGPADRPRPPVQTYYGASQPFRLNADLTQKLKALGQAQGATLYMTLLAAFQVLLYRYTGQEDIRVGSPTMGRRRAEWSEVVGYFVNPVVLRADFSGHPSFAAFLSQVRQTVLAALEHQDFPLALLVEPLMPIRDLSRPPLFQALFALQKAPARNETGWAGLALGEAGPRMDLGALSLEPLALARRRVQFDLAMALAEESEELFGSLEYNADLFDSTTIASLIGHFQILLEGIVAQPDQAVSFLPLVTYAERHQVLVEWNATEMDYPSRGCIHERFEDQASRNPDAVAVLCGEEPIAYGELNRRANHLAHYLQTLGVGPEVRVGLCLERSSMALVGLLGILKAGGAYVPLDPAYPKERLALMLEDARVACLLTQERLKAKLVKTATRVIALDTEWPSIATTRAENPTHRATADNLAYIIYTSGSTGTPKGVMVAHRGLCNLAEAQIRMFGVARDSRFLQFVSFSFDASASDIFTTLLAGATLCLATQDARWPGPALTRWLREQAITTISLPASALAALPSEDLPALRTVIVGGEVCPAEAMARWAVGRRIFNAYGPTEATICATLAEFQEHEQSITIGRPIANTKIYLLDEQQQPVPVGVPGELYIGGVGLARGYWNRPAETAEKFIPDPFSREPGRRLYRTGDRARYRRDGQLEFLGRMDYQVKIRGVRIEPEEIEAVLGQHPAVREAMVLAQEEAPGDPRLIAYVVLNPGPDWPTDALRAWLRERLPEALVPSTFVRRDALPRTPNGKLDRRTRPHPGDLRPERPAAYVAPRTEVERAIVSVWQEVLGIAKVGIHDNFFDLGGHSLRMVQMHSRLQEMFNRDLALVDLFKYPTVDALVNYLGPDKRRSSTEPQSVDRLEKLKEGKDRLKQQLAQSRRAAEKEQGARDE